MFKSIILVFGLVLIWVELKYNRYMYVYYLYVYIIDNK